MTTFFTYFLFFGHINCCVHLVVVFKRRRRPESAFWAGLFWVAFLVWGLECLQVEALKGTKRVEKGKSSSNCKSAIDRFSKNTTKTLDTHLSTSPTQPTLILRFELGGGTYFVWSTKFSTSQLSA